MIDQRDLLRYRGVETPCGSCSGLGVRMYSNGATWRGGMGTANMPLDICDACWGSGDADRHWLNLRTLEADIDARAHALAERRWAELLSVNAMATVRESVEIMAKALETLSRKRNTSFWGARACEYVASVLRGTVPKIADSNPDRGKDGR